MSSGRLRTLRTLFPDAAFGQLRTPLTRYTLADEVAWAGDNGFFTDPQVPRWIRFVEHALQLSRKPLFLTLPDIVGDAARTLELFCLFASHVPPPLRALVIQDGIDRVRIPWHKLGAVFIGGSNAFKKSDAAFNVARTARLLGKHVHVGRVNEVARFTLWKYYADTCDGSGLSRYDHMLRSLLEPPPNLGLI